MTAVSNWDLFEDLRETQDELLRMNRMRAAQWLGQYGQQYGGTATQAWQPALDIAERKDAYLVSVELPGIGIDDNEITFEGSLLTIQGERHILGPKAAEVLAKRIAVRVGPGSAAATTSEEGKTRT